MSEQTRPELAQDEYWRHEAKGMLRAELDRRGVTYQRLAKLMQAAGLNETERAIANKVSRGSFSFAFFLQVMRVLGVQSISLAATEKIHSLPYSGQPGQAE